MTKAEFLKKLEETLMVTGLTPDTELRQLESWDSMAMVEVFGMVDSSLSITLPRGALGGCKYVRDVLDLVKDGLSG